MQNWSFKITVYEKGEKVSKIQKIIANALSVLVVNDISENTCYRNMISLIKTIKFKASFKNLVSEGLCVTCSTVIYELL